MKITVLMPQEIEVDAIHVSVAVRYDEEDIPNDFPLRKGNMWSGTIDIETGKIKEWPKGISGKLSMKVCDAGTYELLSGSKVVAIRENEYVPCCIPGEYGDYINFDIDSNGVIADWAEYCTPGNIDIAFYPEE